MKKFLQVVLLLLPLELFSQTPSLELNPERGIYEYKEIFKIDSGYNAGQIFDYTLEWIAASYRSSKDVLQYQNKETGKIIIKGNFPTSLGLKPGWINHTLTIEFKPERFRCVFTDFSYYSTGSGEIAFESRNLGVRKKFIANTDEKIKESLKSLLSYINDRFKGTKQDNW